MLTSITAAAAETKNFAPGGYSRYFTALYVRTRRARGPHSDGTRELGLDDVLLVDRLAAQHTLKAEARDINLVRFKLGLGLGLGTSIVAGAERVVLLHVDHEQDLG